MSHHRDGIRATLLAAALVQFSKFLAHWIRFREPNFTRLVGTGGMPSAHSASRPPGLHMAR